MNSAAAGGIVQRPAHRVQHEPALVLARRKFPKLFQPDAEFLRIAAFVQLVIRASAASSASRARLPRTACICRCSAMPGVKSPCDGRRCATPRSPVMTPFTSPLSPIDDVGRRKARIDFDAQRFGLRAPASGNIAEAGNVIAVIAHQRREDEIRNADAAGWSQKIESVVRHRRVERRALCLSSRESVR